MPLFRATGALRKAVGKASKTLNKPAASPSIGTTTASSASQAQAVSSAKSESFPIVSSLAACMAGILTVAAGSTAVEQMTASSCPDFDPRKQRFDQSTFLGRYYAMLLKCDPKLLLYSTDECLRAKQMVLDYQNLIQNPPPSVVNIHRSLWEAQRIATAQLHPDTNEIIPAPFRMSGYVPFNGPVSVAMVASGSTPALLFWNWVNQSQNALVNYHNRNAASALSNETLAKSYAAAVGSSICVAFGLATFIQRRYDPATARNLLRFVAFPSAVVASSLNCYIVRSPEITTGIPIVDDKGTNVLPGETSVVAAKRGVYSTTASRAMLQAPVFFLPPALLASVPTLKRMIAKNPSSAIPITTFLLLVSFGFALPATVAVFPQMSEIEVKDLEEKFQNLKNPDTGTAYESLYFNKGL